MALSEEAILQQINVLTTKTSDNPKMEYKSIPALNKGLNPKFFTGNDTKIVNAINSIANETAILNEAVTNMINKVNQILMETYSTENKEIWEQTQALMGEKTIIEGIKAILEGKLQDKILDLHPADAGKILSVKVNSEGVPEVKPVSIESFDVEVGAYEVAYLNRNLGNVTSIGEAVDKICDNAVNSITLKNDSMNLMSNDDEVISSVPLMNDEDVSTLIASLDNE